MGPWVPVFVSILLAVAVTACGLLLFAAVHNIRYRFKAAKRLPRKRAKLTDDYMYALRLVKHADLPKLRRAFEQGLNANLRGPYGGDLLSIAASRGNVAVGELLISKGADVRHIDDNGCSAIDTAVAYGHLKFLRLLLERGAEHQSSDGKPIGLLSPTQLSAKKIDAFRALLHR